MNFINFQAPRLSRAQKPGADFYRITLRKQSAPGFYIDFSVIHKQDIQPQHLESYLNRNQGDRIYRTSLPHCRGRVRVGWGLQMQTTFYRSTAV